LVILDVFVFFFIDREIKVGASYEMDERNDRNTAGN
jgi:hypothetical protein